MLRSLVWLCYVAELLKSQDRLDKIIKPLSGKNAPICVSSFYLTVRNEFNTISHGFDIQICYKLICRKFAVVN